MAEGGPGERVVLEEVRVARFDRLEEAGEPDAGAAGSAAEGEQAVRVAEFGAEASTRAGARVADLDGVSAVGPSVARVAALGTPAAGTAPRRRPRRGPVGPGAPGPGAPGAAGEGSAGEGPAGKGPADEGPTVTPPASPSGRRERVSERRRRGARPQPAAAPEPDAGPDAEPENVARSICLRLLTDRARTRQELAQALRRKGVPEDAADTVLERFDEVGLIDDAAFAEQWVRSRHAVRGLGRRALAVELRGKGVAEDVAGEALAGLDAEAEEQRARQLVERKLRSLPSASAEQRAAAGRRLVGMLARKGYGGGLAYRVVREVLAEHGAEPDELADVPDEG